ncbi:hypothetical protein Tco_0029988 [Tanacetum coccineum]
MDKPPPSSPLSFPPKKRGIAMLAISLFPMTFAESMAVINLKEAQGPWMAGIKTLESLTEEKHFARLKV